MEKKLYVLLGDVKSSRKIENREHFQNELINSYEKINKIYKEDIYANFKIIKGLDEIGCVLSNISHIYEIIIEILDDIYPNSMRFALVLDTINTGLEEKDITKMDGPAFHKASSMMISLKESKEFFNMSIKDESSGVIDNKPQSKGIMIDTYVEELLVKIINLTISIREKWTKNQRQIIKEYEKTMNQNKVAKKHNISQQAVSKQLKNSRWKEVKSLEKSLNNIMKGYSN
jgi:SatD family (SatD)